jgi:ankyrin repeat protein
VFPGATVVRGRDWRWSDQDGGPGKEGTVLEISGWHSESSRSVAVVEWRESSRKRKYRLGHKGKVDLQCTVAAEYGYCYLDHLPVLGAEYKDPATPFISAGDYVVIDMDFDLLQSSLLALGAWDDRIVDFLGKVGLVIRVSQDMEVSTIFFFIGHCRFYIVTSALKKVDGPDILPDDVVRVIDDMAEVHRLQQARRGWEDDMALALGQLGYVGLTVEDGGAVLRVNGRRWVLDPSCVVPAPGEQPEDEMTEAEPSPGLEMLWMSFLQTPNSDMLEKIAMNGSTTVLAEILKKSPELVNVPIGERTLLHIVSAEGWLNCARLLLEYKADMKATDRSGEIPLHNTAHFNHYHVAKLLVDAGSDVNAKGCAGNTPVHVAAAQGFSRVLKLFLEQPNCQTNLQNSSGDTALHLACQHGWATTTRQLVMAGAKLSTVNEQGGNVFLHAVVKRFYHGMEIITQARPDMINHRRMDDGSAPLHVVTLFDHCDMLFYLGSMDTCDMNIRTHMGQAPLHIATGEGHIRSVECLVGYGADVEVKDRKGITPLHFVLAKKNMKPLSPATPHLNEVHEMVSCADNSIQNVPVYITVACFLVSEGASLETVSKEELTPLSLCPSQYHSLLKLFAKPERRGSYRGSLPRHPPPVPISPQKKEATSEASSIGSEVTTPPDRKATPTGDSVSSGNSKKGEESVDSQQPVPTSLNNTQTTSPKNEGVTVSCYLCEGPCDVRFQPCGHTAMCAVCAEPVKRCPTCRNDVLQKIKIST